MALDNFGPQKQVSQMVDLSKENPFSVRGTLKDPGSLRLSLSVPKQKVKSLAAE